MSQGGKAKLFGMPFGAFTGRRKKSENQTESDGSDADPTIPNQINPEQRESDDAKSVGSQAMTKSLSRMRFFQSHVAGSDENLPAGVSVLRPLGDALDPIDSNAARSPTLEEDNVFGEDVEIQSIVAKLRGDAESAFSTVAALPSSWQNGPSNLAVVDEAEADALAAGPNKLAAGAGYREPQSCIRVFRRDGTFSTVSCSIGSTCKDLRASLGRKFFLAPEVADKYRLWVTRNGRETMVIDHEKPLKMQQQWLWEIGFDPSQDKLLDILREDNSYFFRWIYSDVSEFVVQSTSISTMQQLSPAQQKIAQLIQMEAEDDNDKILDLSDCQTLIDLAPRSASINLSNNAGIVVPLSFAQGCSKLTSLCLSNVMLKRVPTVLGFITSLEVLDLSNNLITTLKDSTLQDLGKLTELNLHNNRLCGRSCIPLTIVARWTGLARISLSSNWLKEFPRALLYIGHGGKVTKIEDVSEVYSSALEHLDLSNNCITNLPAEFADAFPTLNHCLLAGNQLTRLPQRLPETLVVFDVRGNHLRSSFGDGLFQSGATDVSINRVNKVLLDGNRITDVRITAAVPLCTLVSHKNIDLLQLHLTTTLSTLTTLVINRSRLASLPDDLFSSTPSLKVLILNHNQLTEIPSTVNALKNLVRFEAVHNALTKLPSCMRGLIKLELMDLRGNNLKSLPSDIWQLALQYLNLSSNVIDDFPEHPSMAGGNRSSVIFPASSSSNRSSIMFSANTDILAMLGQGALALGEDASSTANKRATVMFDNVGNFIIGQDPGAAPACPLASSLKWLSVADNRIESGFLQNTVGYFSALRLLNIAHNEIFNIPAGTLRGSCATMEELVLSGNHLTELPDDLYTLKKLKRLFVNSNRLTTLPPELGKLAHLRILDASCNQLRYNVSNWPHDWNWSWNLELRSLNLAGNPKLEIKPSARPADNTQQQGRRDRGVEQISADKGDIARFDNLIHLRTLNLMDVAVSVPLPEESLSMRVRVNVAGGSSVNWKRQSGLEVAGAEPSGMQPTSTPTSAAQITTAAAILPAGVHTEQSASALPSLTYGVAEDLDDICRNSSWDVALTDTQFLRHAAEEAKFEPLLKPSKTPECLFGLFESYGGCMSVGSKWLADHIGARFQIELKKMFKEAQAKREKTDGADVTKLSTEGMIVHAIRRTFLAVNKQLHSVLAQDGNVKENDDASVRSQRESTPTTPVKSSILESQRRRSRLPSESSAEDSRGRKTSMVNIFLGQTSSNKLIPAVPEEPEVPFAVNPVKKSKDNISLKFDSYEEELCDDYETKNGFDASAFSGTVVYLANNQVYVANCGDCLVIASRNGKATALTTQQNLMAMHSSSGRIAAPLAADDSKSTPTKAVQESQAVPSSARQAAFGDQQSNFLQQELIRLKNGGSGLTRDGLINGKLPLTRAFGNHFCLPSVNATPTVRVVEVTEQDEFLIIGSSSFWNSMDYQTAVDIARMKADDAIEAATVLRDFAVAYSHKPVFVVDEDTESPIRRSKPLAAMAAAALSSKKISAARYRLREPITCMVINLKQWASGKPKKVFNKIKRRRDDMVDSGIARLAPEVEPPTGFVTLVFTDVRNSTKLWDKLPVSMRVAVREHNNIMRRNLRHCNGYEIKTEGDAFIVAFSDLLDAIRWTMTSQLQLLETDWPQDIIETRDGMEVHGPKSLEADEGETLLYRGLSIRMGMHCGYPVCELDPVTRRMDYFGPVINKAARVCSQAEGGQILVSQDVERHFRRLCTSFENSSGSPVPRGRGGRAANGNIAEKMALIKLIDPVFISAGERKLKGFETPEMLISLWPRVIVGRQKVPPPPLEPEKTKTEPPKIEEVKTNGSTEEQAAKVPVDKASEETASAAALAIAVSADSPEPSFTETSVDEASILGQRFGAVIRKLLKQASGEETSQTLLERVEEMLERLEHLVPSVDGAWTAEHCEELIASASSQATKTALRMIQLFISLKTEQQPLESSAGDVA